MNIRSHIQQSENLQALLTIPLAIRKKLFPRKEELSQVLLSRLADLSNNDIVLRVEEFEGEFSLSPKSDIFKRIVQTGLYEPTLARLLKQYLVPDRDVIDIGANLGFFTVKAARNLTTGRVLAIEPVLGAFKRLETNVALNNLSSKVECFYGAASDKEEILQIQTIVGREEYSSLGRIVHPAARGASITQQEVGCITLDELCRQKNLRPAVIKVDVEGAEGKVFRGAIKTIEAHRPVVISELSNVLLSRMGSSADEVITLFQKLNYSVVDPNRPGKAVRGSDFGDILCLPN